MLLLLMQFNYFKKYYRKFMKNNKAYLSINMVNNNNINYYKCFFTSIIADKID